MQGNISKTNGSGVVLPEDVLKEAKTAANEASASAKSALSSALSAEAAAERSEAAASNAENAASEVVSAYISNVPTRNLANVVFENAVLSQTGDFVARTDGLRFASSPDFIKVDGGETYTFSFITNVASGASLNMFEYDADKKYLRNTIVGGLFSSPRTIAVGNDCRYIRLTSFTNKAGEPWENCIPQKFQMEKGDTATEYISPSYNVIEKIENFENELADFENELASKSKTLVIERNENALHNLNAASKYGFHKNGKKNQEKRFTALVTTDVHGDETRLENAIEILNNADAIDVGFCLGDIQSSDFSANDGSWYTDIINTSKKPFYSLLGNHDQKNYSGNSETLVGTGGTPSEAFNKFIQPTLGVLGQDITAPYYKVLNDTYKIAILCLNNYDTPVDKNEDGTFVIPRDGECISAEQLSWFINELNAIPNDYHLIIARHSYPSENQIVNNEWSQTGVLSGSTSVYDDNNMISDIVNAWINGNSLSKTYAPKSGFELCPTHNVNVDFTSRGQGIFVCYLVGHSHTDRICTSTLYENQIVVGVCATAADFYNNYCSDLPRVRGTRSEDAITAVTVDTTERKIRLVRFGSDTTFDLVKRDVTTIDY